MGSMYMIAINVMPLAVCNVPHAEEINSSGVFDAMEVAIPYVQIVAAAEVPIVFPVAVLDERQSTETTHLTRRLVVVAGGAEEIGATAAVAEE